MPISVDRQFNYSHAIGLFGSVSGNRKRGGNQLNSVGDLMPIDIHFPHQDGGFHVKVRTPASSGFNGAT
jgi:hypothetical protein